ncbi:trk system potassium uptake protein TrkH [Labrenzia sp. EL_208]|uniref:Trk system potassium uptake protein n=2 Tax=cellular organisms TaxID=131567 RepID=A0A0M6ZMW7_9HYPH|nr:trk system potassium uptake protein TrkH [Labrenzia sp. EL_142]MBG6158144.1 trk system potassium uptake protein TrkH [Labrenzia sp. EL_162]MBG6166606.1 trk system potassium uptake protein TrkH [Labrenzia sp. EL_195]MBG6172764.1 trk system potassium uptake protein TrkH [Labrenzia sp. EL_132]MBG6196844.1 trk system potassium uptake protein TrkH [Labrenzia sp. EL_159]MBG6202867.1 trk system potassium uptake protein TrkH [Labrenzia sp. EL_13]MBG6206292.1 trk system potassium uptake protein Trk
MISLRPVLNVLGFLYVGLATAMLIPAIVDVAQKNADWQAFVFSALLTGMIGMLLSLAVGGSLREGLDTRQTFILTTLSWASLPAFGALPFLWLGIGYADAVFEAVSGFTTTGSTVLTGLDGLPPGLLVWRSMLQWMGGVGIIVMAIVLLPFLRIGGMQLFQSESSDRSEKIVSRSVELIRLIGLAYLFLTVLCIAAYLATGMELFDAFNHALTTIATGGFSTHDQSFGYFKNPASGWVAVLFMIVGAMPFVLLIQALRGRPLQLWRDPQVRALLGFLALVSLTLTVYLGINMRFPFEEALLRSTFNVVSIVTGTGYALGDFTQWGAPVVGIAFLLMFVGGCTGSTTGGIKIFRFLVFFGTVRAHLRRMVRPHRIMSEEYAGTRLTPELSFSVLAFLVVYMGSVGIITVALSFFDLDLVTAISAAATSVGNVGPGLGPVIGPAGHFAPLPDGAKWLLSFAMLVGRLELFTVLVLLDPDFWSK